MTSYDMFENVLDDQPTHSAVIRTSLGDVTVELHSDKAPLAANNFAFLAKEGFWENTIIHRVIPGFVVQMGDPTGTGTGGPGYTFADELEHAREHGYPRGTLAMANAGPATNGSQFFIVLKDAPLPPNYTVFGHVTDGMEAVDAIAEQPTDRADRPREDLFLLGVDLKS